MPKKKKFRIDLFGDGVYVDVSDGRAEYFIDPTPKKWKKKKGFLN